MFDSKQTLTHRLADAVDLAIDFATLGEYGLEPVGSTPQGCEADRQICDAPARTRQAHLRELYSLRCNGGPKTGYLSSPGRNAARRRGGLGASRSFAADGAA